MVDPQRSSDEAHSRPLWVKVLGLVVAILIAGAIVMALAGGDHGPGQHLPGGEETPAEHRAPAGGHD